MYGFQLQKVSYVDTVSLNKAQFYPYKTSLGKHYDCFYFVLFCFLYRKVKEA